MYHNILLHSSHPLYGALEKATGLLLAFTAVDSVYFSPQLEEGLNEGVIVLILSDENAQAWDEVSVSCGQLFAQFPQFSFRVFDLDWVRSELKDGNPFFAMHCHSNSIIYSADGSEVLQYIGQLKPKRFLKKAKARFRIDDESAFTLGIDVRHYRTRGNYLQAAYNLHQCFRWLYVAASWFLTGEWLVEQDLKVQQQNLGRFSGSLGKWFDPENEREVALLEGLNAACRAVQQGDNVPGLGLAQIQAAEQKKEALRAAVNQLFKECIGRCRYEFSRAPVPVVVAEGADQGLALLAQVVYKKAQASALYCFGQRSQISTPAVTVLGGTDSHSSNTHYFVLLLVKKGQPDLAANIEGAFKEASNGLYTATVLLHTKKSVNAKSVSMRHFFATVLGKGQLVYCGLAKVPYLPFDEVPLPGAASAKRYWQQRARTADFLSEAEAIDGGGATKIHVHLMHLVVEQLCLGLIRVFLHYTPNRHSLPFLLDLCSSFTAMAPEVFPRQTQKDRQLLKVLSGQTGSLRAGYVDDVPSYDYQVLNNRYYEFIERATQLAEAELARLEQIETPLNN